MALAVAALALAGWWLRGKAARSKEIDDEWPEERSDSAFPGDDAFAKPVQAAQPAIAPQPLAVTSPAPKPSAAAAADQPSIGLMLDPLRLSATLTSTSLSYRLSVTNNSTTALSDVVVAGGMISAHASLPVEQQLATDGQMLELLHQLELLAPGETIELTGDLRLPLPQITPIRSGKALLFIPLARFRVEAGSTAALATFVIGETPPVAEAALLPFRIDMGPRIWSRVSRRRVGQAVAA